MITTLIFDLDGLLADTEKLHFESYKISLGELGIEIEEEFYNAHWIRDGLGIREFCQLRNLSLEPSFLRSRKMVVYAELVREKLQPMPGALAALQRFHDSHSVALATSAYTDSANVVIDAMRVRQYFDAIVTGSDVERSKPDPALFWLAASMVHATVADCVVIEDAEKGILAAHRAGMKSIAVPNRHTRMNDFSLATLVLSSLDELTPDLLNSLH